MIVVPGRGMVCNQVVDRGVPKWWRLGTPPIFRWIWVFSLRKISTLVVGIFLKKLVNKKRYHSSSFILGFYSATTSNPDPNLSSHGAVEKFR